jgi:hypothetical protein
MASHTKEIIDAKNKNTKNNRKTLLAIICICEIVNTYLNPKDCIYTHKTFNINGNRFNRLKK